MPSKPQNNQVRPRQQSARAEPKASRPAQEASKPKITTQHKHHSSDRKVAERITEQNTRHNAGTHRPSTHPSRSHNADKPSKELCHSTKQMASTKAQVYNQQYSSKTAKEPSIIVKSMETNKDGSWKNRKVEISRDGRCREYEIQGLAGCDMCLRDAHRNAIDRVLGR